MVCCFRTPQDRLLLSRYSLAEKAPSVCALRVVRHDDFFGNLSANSAMHYVDFHPKVLKHLSFGFSIPQYYQIVNTGDFSNVLELSEKINLSKIIYLHA